MLKKLAKYLRALGYDTLFSEKLSDQDLMERSINENRVLLTRDKALCRETPELYSFYMKPQHPESQLGLLCKYYPIRFEESEFMTRCLECNTSLTEVEKSEVKDRVPPRVYERQNVFKYCGFCNQIFWNGDHVTRLRTKLTRIIEKNSPI